MSPLLCVPVLCHMTSSQGSGFSVSISPLASFCRDSTLLFYGLFAVNGINSGARRQNCFLCVVNCFANHCAASARGRPHARTRTHVHSLLLCVPNEEAPQLIHYVTDAVLGVFRPGFCRFSNGLRCSSVGRHHLGDCSTDLSSFPYVGKRCRSGLNGRGALVLPTAAQ